MTESSTSTNAVQVPRNVRTSLLGH
jgi:hypothetical protein